jgi:hypothetical protein
MAKKGTAKATEDLRVCSGRGAFGRASLPASRCFRQVRLGRSLALPLLEQILR